MKFIRQEKKRNAKCRLFCFSYAGGNGNLFTPWKALCDNTLELVTVQYPGRGQNIQDAPIDNCLTMAKAIANEINQLSDLPSIFLGYSMGGAIAYETAQHLRLPLSQLLLCASKPPNTWPKHAEPKPITSPRYLYSDAALEQDIKRLGGVDERLLHDKEMRDIILRIMRADFKLLDSYQPHNFDLDAKMHIIYGTQDTQVTLTQAALWARFSRHKVTYQAIEGGHFFINSHNRELFNHVQKCCLLSGKEIPQSHTIHAATV